MLCMYITTTADDHILVLEQKLTHYEPIFVFFHTYVAFFGTVKDNLQPEFEKPKQDVNELSGPKIKAHITQHLPELLPPFLMIEVSQIETNLTKKIAYEVHKTLKSTFDTDLSSFCSDLTSLDESMNAKFTTTYQLINDFCHDTTKNMATKIDLEEVWLGATSTILGP